MISLKEAKEKGLKKYFTGIPCAKGHIAERHVSGRSCEVCKKNEVPNKTVVNQWRKENRVSLAEKSKYYYGKNEEKIILYQKEYRKKNESSILAQKKIHYEANKLEILEKNKKYRDSNAELVRESKHKEYLKNKPRYHAHSKAYKIAKLRQTPIWCNLEKIIFFYNEALRLTNETGILHHVDHIVPIKGKMVSGLHTHHNLQVLEGSENIRKNNKFNPSVEERYYDKFIGVSLSS